MVNIRYAEKRATTEVINELIDSVNDRLTKKGRNQFEVEGYGTPMIWNIFEINSYGNKNHLISNASNKEVYLYFLGISIGLGDD